MYRALNCSIVNVVSDAFEIAEPTGANDIVPGANITGSIGGFIPMAPALITPSAAAGHTGNEGSLPAAATIITFLFLDKSDANSQRSGARAFGTPRLIFK